MKSYGLAVARLFLSAVLLFPALATTGAPPKPSARIPEATASGGPPLIEVRENRLTVKLHRVPWEAVLKELKQKTGLTFRVEGRLNGVVTETFKALPLEEGLRRLLHNADLMFLYEGQGPESRLAQVWILLRPETAQALKQLSRKPSREAADPLGSLIENALGAEGGEERWKAVEALAGYRDPRVQDALLLALQDPDEDVRESAADALADFKDEAAVDYLSRALLEDEDEDVRETAADALGEIASPRAVEALQQALAHESADVRWSAVDALGRIGGDRAIEALKRALQDEDEDVRETAREALIKLKETTSGD